MAEPEEIMVEAGRILEPNSVLTDRIIVVTAGPTHEAIDPVRFIGNRSSGRMGFELAASAWRRGAEVVCIHGPVSVAPPVGPRTIEVEDAVSMLAALREELDGASVLCMAAAVSDFRVEQPADEKIKKEKLRNGSLSLELAASPDLLLETMDLRAAGGVFTLGFALETTDGVSNATTKLETKKMNLVALNQAGAQDAGFEVETNRITLIDPSGAVEELPLLSKREAADRLLDRIEDRLRDGD